VVGVIVVWHVLMVRLRGVVPPIDAVDREVSTETLADATVPEARP
jgi:hypothetical protein